MGWVFQGSPDKLDIDDYLSRYPQLIYWRTPRYTRDIAVGDRAFIWRSGKESGAVAVGAVVEAPVPRVFVGHPEALGDDLWIAEKPDSGEPVTGIRIDELRLSGDDGMLPRDIVRNDPELGGTTLIRMPNGSVFKLSEGETKSLERLWGVSTVPEGVRAIEEGERKFRAHSTRERSPRLRVDKLTEFKRQNGSLYCELCLEGQVSGSVAFSV